MFFRLTQIISLSSFVGSVCRWCRRLLIVMVVVSHREAMR